MSHCEENPRGGSTIEGRDLCLEFRATEGVADASPTQRVTSWAQGPSVSRPKVLSLAKVPPSLEVPDGEWETWPSVAMNTSYRSSQ